MRINEWIILFHIILLLSFYTQKSYGQEKYRFSVLLQKMLNNNPDLIDQKGAVNQSQILYSAISRFNSPELTGSYELSRSRLEQTSFPTLETDLNVDSYSLGIDGKLPRYGLEYNLLYGQNSQDQNEFTLTPAISKTGKNLSLTTSLNLLEDAGFKIGHFLFDEKKIEYEISQTSYNFRAQELALELIQNYLQIIVLQQKLADTQKIQALADKLFLNYQNLHNEGQISKVDLLSASIEANIQKSNLISLSLSFKETKRRLLNLVGGFSDEEINADIYFESLEPTWLKDKKIESNSQDFNYSANPQLALIENQKRLVGLRLQSLQNKILPTLKLSSGYSKIENPLNTILDDSRTASDRWFVGLNLSFPLNNIGARADSSAQRIQKNNLELQGNLLKMSVDLRMQGLKNEIQAVKEQLQIVRETEKQSRERYRSAIPLTKVSASARIDIFTFQNQLIQTQYEIADLEASLIAKKSEILLLRGELVKNLRY